MTKVFWLTTAVVLGINNADMATQDRMSLHFRYNPANIT